MSISTDHQSKFKKVLFALLCSSRTKLVAWALLFPLLGLWIEIPIQSRLTRSLAVLTFVTIVVSAIRLSRNSRTAICCLMLTLAIFAVILTAPVRPAARDVLQRNYVEALRKYSGTRYIWGGETAWGIDCSGLVRRAMVDSLIRTAVTTGNPGLLRSGVDIWWHDCTARDLGVGYARRTSIIAQVNSIRELNSEDTAAGDLAVVADGVHVLAFVGNQTWIEANPEQRRVIFDYLPVDKNHWIDAPATIVRWDLLR